jgi:hypothetical protein
MEIKILKIISMCLLTFVLILSSCSGSELMHINSFNTGKCTDEKTITDSDASSGLAVDSLTAIQTNNLIEVGMNVRSYCNSEFSLEIKNSDSQLELYLSNVSGITDNCLCTKKVRLSFNKPDKGFYNIVVTNSTGTLLLDEVSLKVE